MSTDTVPQTERISFAAATAIILDTYDRLKLPFPYAIGQNDRGDNDLLVMRFNTIADMDRWITEAFQDERKPRVETHDSGHSGSLHIWGWKGWTVALYASDPLSEAEAFARLWDEAHTEQGNRLSAEVDAIRDAADRFQAWYDRHSVCCGPSYRDKIDHERRDADDFAGPAADLAAVFGAVDPADPIPVAVVTVPCGRCVLGIGRHSFGSGCQAKTPPVPVFTAAERRELLHLNNPGDIAPGEPDDRGWDAPIKVAAEPIEPGFKVPGPHTARLIAEYEAVHGGDAA